jgi:hypothetical protein
VNSTRKTLWSAMAIATLLVTVLPTEAHAQNRVSKLIQCLETCEQNTPPCSAARFICIADCIDAFLRPLQPTEPLMPPASATVPPLDTTPPTCPATPGPSPSSMLINVRDTGSGLATIFVAEAINANVAIPGFTSGTTNTVQVTVTKIDPNLRARAQFAAIDACGNVSPCDPVMTGVLRSTGKPVSESYTELPSEEDVVTILNGSPGFSNLDVIVNGRKFKVTGMKDGQERDLDISSAVLPGNQNIVTLKGHGKPGSSAAVLIWDGGE